MYLLYVVQDLVRIGTEICRVVEPTRGFEPLT
jgi:hypothetical protein